MKKKILGLEPNIFFLGLTSFFNDFSSEMIASILPAFFISVLKSGAASLGLMEGVAEAFSNIMKIYSGRWSDKIQNKKIFAVFGYTLSVATRPFYLLAYNVSSVLGLRVTDRIGKGLRDAPRDALISLSVPKNELGRSFGYHRAMDTSGAILGPLVAYILLLHFPNNFHLIFITSFCIGIIAIISVLYVKDIVGTFTKNGGLGASLKKFPKSFHIYLIVLFILSLGTLPTAVLLLKTQDLGLLIASIPLFYMISNVAYALVSIPGGKAADKIGAEKIIALGYIILLFAYVTLALSHSIGLLAFGFILVGVFSGLTDATQRAYISHLIGEERKGEAYGYLNAVVGIGSLIAGIVGGAIWQHGSDTLALILGGSMLVIGLFVFSLLILQKRSQQS